MLDIKIGNAVLYREWADLMVSPTLECLPIPGLVIEMRQYYENEHKPPIDLYIILVEGNLKQCYRSEIELLRE